jgi:hypothetical protein
MKIIIAEAIGFKEVNEKQLLHARRLDQSNEKYIKIIDLFKKKEISFFYELGIMLNHYINKDKPLVFVTDWTDPTEMVGLLLEDGKDDIVYPDLGFLAFYTDWNDLENSGIEKIFSHEFSHLWLYNLGYDFELSPSNKFHTITAITDPFMAFSEGFAEHLEIVSSDLSHHQENNLPFDSGFDIESWLSYRDCALRMHAVKNNRFIYLTAHPKIDTYKTYAELHMAHITSSCFTPEHIKNGSQMMASEGVIASFFYYFYKDEFFKNQYQDELFYQPFGTQKAALDAISNHYLKILFALSKIDLTKETLMVDFVMTYANAFPNEKEIIFELFLRITHFATVDEAYISKFENLYLTGKQGNPDAFKEALMSVRTFRKETLSKIIENPEMLKNGLYQSIWITTNQYIKPVPWDDKMSVYKIDINTATAIDLLALPHMDILTAEKGVSLRKSLKGFESLDQFINFISTDKNLNV